MPRRYNQPIVVGPQRDAKRSTTLANLKCKLWIALIVLAGGPAVAAADDPAEKSVLSADSPGVLGELYRTQKWLADLGINLNAIYSNSALANLKGGLRRGAIDQGKLETALAIDLEKLAGYKGLSFYANTFQIHNTGRFRRDYIGGINTIDAIEALSTTRLSELWLEQKFWNGNASVKFGQLAADIEFFNSGLSEIFLQSDWPTITAVNLPSGGPAYPLSTPGVRLKIEPQDNVALLLAVFNGDPAGPGTGDPQVRNRNGLNFRVGDPPLFMAEAQFRNNYRPRDTGLATMMKAGGWVHLGKFDDQRFAADGTLLATNAPMTPAAQHRGNFGIYGVIEQQLYRPQGGSATSGVSMFTRISASPSDRNQISFFIDGGVIFSDMIPSRPDDKFGASVIYARFSDSVRAFDQDQIIVTGVPGIVRDYEMNLELTYLAQVRPGWTVQPVVTFIWHPNGDAERNALATGVKSIWRF